MYKCLECNRKFKTTKAAERAMDAGCPGCGGSDIDLDVEPRGTVIPDDGFADGGERYTDEEIKDMTNAGYDKLAGGWV